MFIASEIANKSFRYLYLTLKNSVFSVIYLIGRCVNIKPYKKRQKNHKKSIVTRNNFNLVFCNDRFFTRRSFSFFFK